MSDPLTRRRFGEAVAATVAVGPIAAGAAPADNNAADPAADAGGRPREPLLAPRPPAPRGVGTQAALLYEVLLGQFPETRVEAKRAAIARQIAANLVYGRVLAAENLTNADGPGPLWAAFRADDDARPADPRPASHAPADRPPED